MKNSEGQSRVKAKNVKNRLILAIAYITAIIFLVPLIAAVTSKTHYSCIKEPSKRSSVSCQQINISFMGRRTKNFLPILGAEVEEEVRITESQFGSGRTVFYQVVILSPKGKTTWFYYRNKEQAQATVNSINKFVNNSRESFLKIN